MLIGWLSVWGCLMTLPHLKLGVVIWFKLFTSSTPQSVWPSCMKQKNQRQKKSISFLHSILIKMEEGQTFIYLSDGPPPWHCGAPRGCPQTSWRWGACCTFQSAGNIYTKKRRYVSDWRYTEEQNSIWSRSVGPRWPEGRSVVIVTLRFQNLSTLGPGVVEAFRTGHCISLWPMSRCQWDVVLPILASNQIIHTHT